MPAIIAFRYDEGLEYTDAAMREEVALMFENQDVSNARAGCIKGHNLYCGAIGAEGRHAIPPNFQWQAAMVAQDIGR